MPTSEERSASSKIIGSSYKLFISSISLLPFRWRRKLYKSYVDNIGEKAFSMYGAQIVLSLCFSRGASRGFTNTKKEVSGILEWIPKLEKYRGVLQEHIKKQRRKYNLKV